MRLANYIVPKVPAVAQASQQTAADRFEIASIDSKVTETNRVWWKYAWKLTLKNKTDKTAAFAGEVEFYDKDGFIIDTSRADSMIVESNSEGTFTGYALVSLPAAGNIAKTGAKIHIVSR